jgi:hypothetical protein
MMKAIKLTLMQHSEFINALFKEEELVSPRKVSSFNID